MDSTLFLKTMAMGVVEGITEFLPVSSTGHLILMGNALDFLTKDKRAVFEIFIQLGAILAVVWEYRSRLAAAALAARRLPEARRFFENVAIAFAPAAIVGLAIGSQLQAQLFSPGPVAVALIAGGFVILWAERRPHAITTSRAEQISRADALKIGVVQCLALIPGTSRSGATIIGGLFLGLSRQAATEFSFFLGIPTLAAASGYSLLKHRAQLSADDIGVFSLGLIVSFVSALLAIRALVRYVSRHDFSAFAWYRIGLGLVILGTQVI